MIQRFISDIIWVMALLFVLASSVALADMVTITASQTQVRSEPNYQQSILATLKQGSSFELLETRRGWLKIRHIDGRAGWIAPDAAQVQCKPHDSLSPKVVSPAPQDREHRDALVIGNSDYQGELLPLKNPVNDAHDMGTKLRELGFDVTLITEATKPCLVKSVKEFIKRLRPGSVGLFYFAGHGVRGQDGANYVIPVRAQFATADDVQHDALSVEWVLAQMEEVGKTVNILILDACRNAPFTRSVSNDLRSMSSGLAPMHPASGSFLAFATGPGRPAAEGQGRNGTYTEHLLRWIAEPNLNIEQLFKRVRRAVERETSGWQRPWESSSLTIEFSFNPIIGGNVRPIGAATPSRDYVCLQRMIRGEAC